MTIRALFIAQVNDTRRIMLNNAQDVKTSNYEKIATYDDLEMSPRGGLHF